MDDTGTDTMAAAETEITESESERIQRWRAEELERAGFTSSQALELAMRPDVDLHDAVDLIRRGCSIELAMQILV
jgi:hypothetical protein